MADSLFSDDPIETEDEDLFERVPFAQHVAALLRDIHADNHSAVLGLFAPWGGGKTSLLKLVSGILGSERWKVVWFNPWQLSDIDSILVSFFNSIIHALPEGGGENSLRKRVASYAAAIAPYASLIKISGLDFGHAAVGLSSLLGDTKSLSELRQDVIGSLSEQSDPYLIVIDDIDRLQPEELLLIFKLVRLIGNLPNVYYLVAFDEATVIELLCASDVARGDKSRALDFLEKIIQVRLDIPPPHQFHLNRLFDAKMDRLLEVRQVQLTEEQVYRFASNYHDILKHKLTEPRSVKRYLTQIHAYLPLVSAEVDIVDFCFISFLRTFYPGVYATVRRSREELTGTNVSRASSRESPEQRLERWKRILTDECRVPENQSDLVLGLLRDMFIPIEEAFARSTYSQEFYVNKARGKRIGSAAYFERYFQFGIPPGDISDSDMFAAVQEWEKEEEGEHTERLRVLARTVEGSERALEKIELAQESMSPVALRGLFRFLASIYPDLRTGFVSPREGAELLGYKCLAGMDGPPAVADVLELSGGLVFLSRTLLQTFVRLERQGSEPPSWMNEMNGEVLASLRQRLGEATARPLREQEGVEMFLFFWARLEGRDAVNHWLQSVLSSTAWNLDELLGLLNSPATSYGGGPPRRVLTDFRVSALEAILDVDWCFAELHQLEDVPLAESMGWRDDEDVTFENRIRQAKLELKRELTRREARL